MVKGPRNTSTFGDTTSAGRSEFFTGLVRQNWDASARVRLGGLLTPSILLYATGGAAFASVDSAFSYSATTVYNEVGGGSVTHTTSGSPGERLITYSWHPGASLSDRATSSSVRPSSSPLPGLATALA